MGYTCNTEIKYDGKNNKKAKLVSKIFDKTLKIAIFFSVICVASVSANAVTRGTTCTISADGGSNLTDGSNCDQGLICDPSVLICVASSDTACSGQVSCPVGQSCVTVGSGNSAGTKIGAGSSSTGVCKVSEGNVESNAFGDTLCNAYKFVTGKLGRGIAVCAIVALAIFFFMGKVTWGSALAIILGIGALFGAPAVVSILTGRNFVCA